MYMTYGLLILVHRETFRSLPQRSVTFSFVRALSVSMWIILTEILDVYWMITAHEQDVTESYFILSLNIQMMHAKMNLYLSLSV